MAGSIGQVWQLSSAISRVRSATPPGSCSAAMAGAPHTPQPQPACILHAMIICVATPLQIRNMPDDALEAIRERAARRHLSLAAYARAVLVREASRATMEETLAGPRALPGRPLTPRDVDRLIPVGAAWGRATQ